MLRSMESSGPAFDSQDSGGYESGGTSTSKALLVSIVVPRIFCPPPPPSSTAEEDERDVDGGVGDGKEKTDAKSDGAKDKRSGDQKSKKGDESKASASDATSSTRKNNKEAQAPTAAKDDRDASTTAGDESENEKDTVKTKDEGVNVLKAKYSTKASTSGGAEGEGSSNFGDDDGKEAATADEGSKEAAAATADGDGGAITKNDPSDAKAKEEGKGGTMDEGKKGEGDDNDDDEEEHEPTEEEKAAVVVGDDLDDMSINVGELLRIAMRELLSDFHFFNVPTYSAVGTASSGATVTTGNDAKSDSPEGATTALPPLTSTWIQCQVMARPSSIGAILERLERIGVGSDVGTVSIYKAELCWTASPYAHHHAAAMSERDEAATSAAVEAEKAGEEKENLAQRIGRFFTSDKKDGATAVAATAATSGSQTNGTTSAESESAKEEGGDEVGAEAAASTAKTPQMPSEETRTEREIEAAKAEWKNAATRLRIEQVREQIADQAALSFDFLALLIIASILAGVGLITNNTVVIVASMLVSPIMGPVLGMTFGGRIRDWPLALSSFQVETIALSICVVVGVLIGLCAAFTDNADTWPTNEMQIRGEATGLYTGIAIAIPSGAGVCLSILGGNTGSLVGVAISASLLPPAVNSGICWIYAILLKANAVESTSHDSGDFAEIGSISFALTALNIVCIWISGIVMFAIKEVAPTKQKSSFWARDIKVARELNEGKDKSPPPVDVSVLRQGVRKAIEKQKSSQTVHSGEMSPRRKETPKLVRLEKPTLDSTLALEPGHREKKEEGLMSFWGSLWDRGGRSEDEEARGESEEVDENVRTVSMEDMAQLLGFDGEDDDYIDHNAVARKIGHGRYL